jgi:hypothetical protein
MPRVAFHFVDEALAPYEKLGAVGDLHALISLRASYGVRGNVRIALQVRGDRCGSLLVRSDSEWYKCG